MQRNLKRKEISISQAEVSTTGFYEREAARYADQTRHIDMGSLYGELLGLVSNGGRILDAGCGSGRDALYFKERGFEVTAMDASSELAKNASEFLGQEVLVGRHQDLEFDREFEGVWANATLLHVPREEQLDVWKRLKKALVPGGVIFASYKTGEPDGFDSKGRWFSYYSEEDLRDLIKQTGMEVVTVRRYRAGLPITDCIAVVAKKGDS